MNDRLPSLSIEARRHHPYRSLYAALLLQSFQDALDEAMSGNMPDRHDEAEAFSRPYIPAKPLPQ